MPLKDWRKIQTILTSIGLRGDLRTCTLVSHEIGAATAALTAYLYPCGQTESVEDEAEGYITLPKKEEWRNLKV
jgi:predicted nuclease with RNAse H fold